MRFALLGLAAVATIAAYSAAHAQESFFNKRYCTMGGSDQSSGAPDCSYNTWEQCQASARGLSRYCTQNPSWRPDAANERTQRGKRARD